MSRRGENIYKRKDGRWEGRYIKGYDGGKAKYGYVFARTYNEVKNELARVANRSILLENDVAQKSMQSDFFSTIADAWLVSKKAQWKQSSVVKYTNILESYIFPEFANKEISEITRDEVVMFSNKLLDSGGMSGKGLSPKTVTSILSVMKNVFAYAVQVKGCDALDLKSVTVKQSQKPMRILSRMEQQKLSKYLYENINPCNLGIFLCIGGEYVSPSAEEKCNKWMKRNGSVYGLQKGYGMCECGGVVTNTITSCNVVGSAGIPLPHVTVSAFDLESGEELKDGERGEIRVLTPCRMSGYFNKPDETAKRLHTDVAGNVWVCTGDMGYVKEDGNVYISGRISDSYVGERGKIIYLFDVERAILDVWQVRQCKAVVSEIDGEQVHVCHLVLEDGADKEETLAQIRRHCSEALEEHCQPRWFKFYDDALPVAPSGKLDVVQMQDDIKRIVEGKSQRIS